MAYEGTHSTRDWHEVAAELSRETNSEHIAELSEELLRAIDAEEWRPLSINASSENQKRAAR